jgi:hypothetical protein
MSRTGQEDIAGGPTSSPYRQSFSTNFLKRPALNAVAAAGLTNADASHADNTAIIVARAIANRDWEVVGTNMTTALCTFADGGGITITTAGADADNAILTPHLDTNQSSLAVTKWNTNDEPALFARIKTGANVTNAIIWIGFKLTNTPVVATDADQVYLRYEDDVNSGSFQAISTRGGTDTTTSASTGTAIAVSTTYDIAVWLDSNRIPHYRINGIPVAQADNTALDADTDLIPYIGVEADGAAAAKAITVRKVSLSKLDND